MRMKMKRMGILWVDKICCTIELELTTVQAILRTEFVS